jgi:two-component system NtrC family sensor kinase
MKEPPELDSGSAPAEVERAERRLAARSRELDALQTLGRRAAEARTPDELFVTVIAALHRAEELDLALVAFESDGEPVLRLHRSRPFDESYVREVVARAWKFLGWTGKPREPRRSELEGFDSARGRREAFREEDVVLLPLVRAGQPVACLVVVPTAEANEQRLRLLYSASNQLSLHLDRLLCAREAETDRFRAIFEAMPQGVVLVDRNLHVIQANRSAERMLADCGGDRASFESLLERLALMTHVEGLRAGHCSVAEGEAQPDGDRTWSVTVSRMPDEEGAKDRLVFVLTDITERRRLQQQLAQSEKMSSLGQMISGVAHELNNPLASIVGYTQLIRGAAEQDGPLHKRVEVLGREAERCRKIVRNLLSFVRHHEPEHKPLSLNQVVENVVALLRYQLRVDGIRVESDLDRGLPALVGDAHQLEQVLVNLLTNAAQAIRQTGEPGTVTLQTRPGSDGGVLLEIRDTGPGIPETARSRIFDPFFTTKGPGEGTGLGLSLVYGIVTAHGGTIEALHHEDPGTTFRIRLPGGRSQPRTEAVTRSPSPPPKTAGRVLVVDDDEAVARLICDALDKDGLIAQRASDGWQALERLMGEPFDLVICDVKMPDMNGERLYEELCRTRPELARRVLWTTGDTLGTAPDELARRTGLAVLTKPFDLDELRDRVREHLDRTE